MRFDKPCLNAKGAVGYFRENMGIGDYLTEGKAARMSWAGRGAERLGLDGACDLVQFELLCAGRHPLSGEKLLVRDKGTSRRVCFFGQISAPKDVSLACLVGGDHRIAAWWDEAVRATVTEIETTTLTRVRRGRAYADRPTGNFIASVVTHDSSRALDPQLHTHVCILNLTYDETEARWKGVQPSAFYRHQAYFREVCHQHLAARMMAAGYRLTDVRHGNFNLLGMPAALRERFSKRRRDILETAKTVGARSQDALQAVTSSTRAAKRPSSPSELVARWHGEAGPDLATVRLVVAAANGARRAPRGPSPIRALISAEAHLFERRSVVDEHELLREALQAGQGDADLPGLRTALASRTRNQDLIRIGPDLATPDGLRSEEEILSWANAGRHDFGPLGIALPTSSLAPDQESAARTLLSSRSRVTVFLGDAGTGKTTTLRAIVSAIESAGGSVAACAPTSRAADLLRHELTPHASTLQLWLASPALLSRHRGATLVVDEAGLMSVTQLRDLCRIADANQNRLLLVGDPKQHHSVEAGDALRALLRFSDVPKVRLQGIRRQRDPAYRAAVRLLAEGRGRAAFERFEALGAVTVAQSETELLHAAAMDCARTLQQGESCLALAPVWSEVRALNEAVRQNLLATGQLGPGDHSISAFTSFHLTREERRRPSSYGEGHWLLFNRPAPGFRQHELAQVQRVFEQRLEVRRADGTIRWVKPHRIANFEVGTIEPLKIARGERLLVRANARKLNLRNGDLVEVATIRPDRTLVLKDGRKIPPTFLHLSHGYATTSHAAQGRTVDRGILFMGDAGLRAGNAQQAYVSLSRFRRTQAIYTTNKEEALAAFARSGDRRLATEALAEWVTPSPSHSPGEEALPRLAAVL